MKTPQEEIKEIAQGVFQQNTYDRQFSVIQSPFHTHNGSDSPNVAFPNITQRYKAVFTRTWLTSGNTDTVTSRAILASSFIIPVPKTPSSGNWAVVVNPLGGSFTITSSDSESAGLIYKYLVF